MKRIGFEVMRVRGNVRCIVLTYRSGRMPLAQAVITPYGEVQLTGADGVKEVIGDPKKPCPTDVLARLRDHAEGLLVVEMAPAGVMPDLPDGGPVGEQMVRASFPKP